MDYKKSKAPVNTVTRNIMDLCRDTDNIYESVAIISKREEVFENREQIEISRYYEKLPKATLLATQEFVEDRVYWRDPSRDNSNNEN